MGPIDLVCVEAEAARVTRRWKCLVGNVRPWGFLPARLRTLVGNVRLGASYPLVCVLLVGNVRLGASYPLVCAVLVGNVPLGGFLPARLRTSGARSTPEPLACPGHGYARGGGLTSDIYDRLGYDPVEDRLEIAFRSGTGRGLGA